MNPERALSCSTLRDHTDMCLFVYLLRTTLTFIGQNWGLGANWIIALLAINVLNEIITFPACFPNFHLRTRISLHYLDSDSWTSEIQHPTPFSCLVERLPVIFSHCEVSHTLMICRSNFFIKGITFYIILCSEVSIIIAHICCCQANIR